MQSINSYTRELEITSLKTFENISILQESIPKKPIQRYKEQNKNKFRERVYTLENTMFGMIYQASQNDKSKQNAVIKIGSLHDELIKGISEKRERIKEELEKKKPVLKKAMGRPKKRILKVQKSKEKRISLNPSSYGEATVRFPLEIMEDTFKETTLWFFPRNGDKKWKGHHVYITDGTTFKTPDTKELREYFDKADSKSPPPLPIGKLQGLINLYGGGLVGAEIGKYTSSEHRMIRELYEYIPKGTVLLGDDLYSSYGHFSYCINNGIELIVQGKHERTEKIIKKISKNDMIVEWECVTRPVWYRKEDKLNKKIRLRKIVVPDIEDPEQEVVIYTTLTDEEKYSTNEITTLFFRRWDIEISFRQIKTILEMEYLRGQSVAMIEKEVYAHLILYNIIRKLMKEGYSAKNRDFSPLRRKIQVSTPVVKGAYVDRLGRSYTRWNAGRNKKNITNIQT